MIRLGDLVGAVLNEMAIARTKATLFGLQMAVDFREHELLSHLPIHVYEIGGAEVNLPFAVAAALSVPYLAASELAAAGREVAAALPDLEGLKREFSLHDDQAEQWRRQAVAAIAERFAADVESMSIDGMSTMYGCLVRSQYLLSLIRARERIAEDKIRESTESRFADSVEEAARRLIKDELVRRSAGSGEEGGAPPVQAQGEEKKGLAVSTPAKVDSAVWVHVEADKLKDAEHVSMLRLELEEGTLDRMTFLEAQEVSDE